VPSPESRAAAAQLLVLDVETDQQVYCGETGEELKAFDIEDGLGLKLLHETGVKAAIILDPRRSGRGLRIYFGGKR